MGDFSIDKYNPFGIDCFIMFAFDCAALAASDNKINRHDLQSHQVLRGLLAAN
jgi:hypothetical protein